MATETMNVALPDSMLAYVAQRVELGQYDNTSEYVCDLIRKDQRVQQILRLRRLVEEGLASGPAAVDEPEDWVELHGIANGSIE